MSSTDRPTRPEVHIADFDFGEGDEECEVYLKSEADAYMDELEAQARELDHQNSVLMMDLESCEEGGGESNRQLRDRIRELEADVGRQKSFVAEWEEDSACLPEDQSITETVTALRNRITALEGALRRAYEHVGFAVDPTLVRDIHDLLADSSGEQTNAE